ncbi:hypothetical protein PSP6_80137 [Paraburkholderia tropica]|nr:hypothetical protein PSP6_80137 [Paraburkholderia tropica]
MGANPKANKFRRHYARNVANVTANPHIVRLRVPWKVA